MSTQRRPPSNAEKAASLIECLREHEIIRVHFFMGAPGGSPEPGLVMPTHVIAASKDGRCALDIGTGLARPITDLLIDEGGMRGTFSFSASPFYVIVPWETIGGIEIIQAREPVKPKGWPLVDVTPDIAFEAKYQDFAKVPKPGKPALRVVARTPHAE